MEDRQPFDLAMRPRRLEHAVAALMALLYLMEFYGAVILVSVQGGRVVDALAGPGPPEWWTALGLAVILVVFAGVLALVVFIQVQSKIANPVYIFRRYVTSKLLAGDDGVDLGDGGERRWSDIAGFEVRRDIRAGRGGTWVEVSAVMRLRSGKELELPAIGCFHDRWATHAQMVEQRVQRLEMLLRSAG
jgi:hypothetical protein